MRSSSPLAVAYGLYTWFVLLVIVLLTTIILAILPGLKLRRRVARNSARAVFWFSRVTLSISGHPPDSGPCVVVSNHASYLDGIIMTAVLPPNFSFLIKREMTSVPIASLLLKRLGSQFVERFNAKRGATDTRRIIRSARAGESLAAFPEGTFRAEPGLGRFQAGAFSAAVNAGLPVVPATILGSRAILPASRRLPVPGDIEIIIHEAIPTIAAGGRQEMARVRDLAHASILTALEEPDLGFKILSDTVVATNSSGPDRT